MLLQSRKVAPHNCSPKLFFKVATESRIPKKLLKTPKLLPEAALELVRKAVQSCSPKLLPKAVARRCSPKLFSKTVPQRCDSANLFTKTAPPKPFCKAAPESCAPMLLPKAAPQSCCPKLLPQNRDSSNLYSNMAPQSYSAKRLPKVATESCSPKWFVYSQIVILVVINWGYAVIDCGCTSWDTTVNSHAVYTKGTTAGSTWLIV